MIKGYLLNNKSVYLDEKTIHVGGSWKKINNKIITWDVKTIELLYNQLKNYKNPILFDIGANTGSFCLLSKFHSGLECFAFEPNPKIFNILQRNIRLNNLQNKVSSHNIALSNTNGDCVLKIPKIPNESGLSCIGNPIRFNHWEEVKVKTITLDTFIKENKILKIDFLKIDTEGTELLILQGGINTLIKHHPEILLKFNPTNTQQFNYYPEEIIYYLKNLGYKKYCMVSHDDLYFYSPKSKKNNFFDINFKKTLLKTNKNIEKLRKDFSHWIELIKNIKKRLFYNDQTPDSLISLYELTKEFNPDIIIEIGAGYGLSTRVWPLAAPNAVIHIFDLDFNPFKEIKKIIPINSTNIIFHERNILSVNLSRLWDKKDKVILFIDAHDSPEFNIMDYLIQKVFPFLPDDSLIIVDDIWYSKNNLTQKNIKEFFENNIISQIDLLTPFLCYFAPYFKGGSFCGFREVIPYLNYLNSNKIEINFKENLKHVWFYKKDIKLRQNKNEVNMNSMYWGYYKYHPIFLENIKDENILELVFDIKNFYENGDIINCINTLIKTNLIGKNKTIDYFLSICLSKIGEFKKAYNIISKNREQLKNNKITNLYIDSLEKELKILKKRNKKDKNGLTIFCVPKDFKNLNKIIQYNAIKSWTKLTPSPEIILMGNGYGVKEFAKEIGAKHISEIETNEYGTPLINDIFYKAWEYSENDVLMYVNSDIIILNNFIKKIKAINKLLSDYLIIGERWDLFIFQYIDFNNKNWKRYLRRKLKEAFLHGESGLDYFIHKRGLWNNIPPFAIGRTSWDNWLVKEAKENNAVILDATNYIAAIHQEHDWNHCDNGRQGAWNGIEALRNRMLAGKLDNQCYTTAANFIIDKNGKLLLKKSKKPRCETEKFKKLKLYWLKENYNKLKDNYEYFCSSYFSEILND